MSVPPSPHSHHVDEESKATASALPEQSGNAVDDEEDLLQSSECMEGHTDNVKLSIAAPLSVTSHAKRIGVLRLTWTEMGLVL
jgi:homoserine kinase